MTRRAYYRKKKFQEILQETKETSRLQQTSQYLQHGHTTVYQHSVSVAYKSYCLADFLHIPVDEKALVQGALLHDYFLYDWHEKGDGSHRLHGFRHPQRAYENAMQDFVLSDREADVIRRHMFPLTPVPPRHREGMIVCLVDKYCSLLETLRR